jgi:hypothetical protein
MSTAGQHSSFVKWQSIVSLADTSFVWIIVHRVKACSMRQWKQSDIQLGSIVCIHTYVMRHHRHRSYTIVTMHLIIHTHDCSVREPSAVNSISRLPWRRVRTNGSSSLLRDVSSGPGFKVGIGFPSTVVGSLSGFRSAVAEPSQHGC